MSDPLSGSNALLDSTPELATWLRDRGEPGYRARQIADAILRRGVADFAAMTELPAELREALAERFAVLRGQEVERTATPGGTAKLLLRWPDGGSTETVLIPVELDRGGQRNTVCVSTQVGCDVGCRFCASGLDGSLRNLTVAEILEQVFRVRGLLQEQGRRLTHVVFMGMGEPLANYEATVEAVHRLNDPDGFGISQRRITISTVGLPRQIERLAEEGLQTTLALSLHAPNDALRRELIPWASGIPLQRLLEACQVYRAKTGRQLTLEYCLLAGVNDRDEHAMQLSDIARTLRAHVNLMSFNPVPDLPFERPNDQEAVRFLHRLRDAGVPAHLRHSRGLSNDAACGQLRRRHETSAAAS